MATRLRTVPSTTTVKAGNPNTAHRIGTSRLVISVALTRAPGSPRFSAVGLLTAPRSDPTPSCAKTRPIGLCGGAAEVLQCAADARVAPRRVLVRQARDERGEVWPGARSTSAALRRAVVFVATSRGYQRKIVSGVTMPATSATRRRPMASPLTVRQADPLIVGEPESPRFELLA
jgi:hypothetical protein